MLKLSIILFRLKKNMNANLSTVDLMIIKRELGIWSGDPFTNMSFFIWGGTELLILVYW